MTTHCAVFCPGDEKQGPRLYWASDRKVSFGDEKIDRMFEYAPKACGGAALWVAGCGLHRAVVPAVKLAHTLDDVWEFAAAAQRLSEEQRWPKEGDAHGDQRPEFLVCDRDGLWYVDSDQDPMKVKTWCPVPIGSGRRYALGAVYALMPKIATARTDWASIVRRAVLVAGECDEGTEGVESGVWTPGPAVLELPDYEAVAV